MKYAEKKNRSISRETKLVDEKNFDNLLIVGDFNYPLIEWSSDDGKLRRNDKASKVFLEQINTGYLTQCVIEPTLGDNYLDLVLVNNPFSIYNVNVQELLGTSMGMQLHSSLYWKIWLGANTAQVFMSRLDFNKSDYVSIIS